LSEREGGGLAILLARKATRLPFESSRETLRYPTGSLDSTLNRRSRSGSRPVPLRYDDLLDAEPLNRQDTLRLVEEVEKWGRKGMR
jgi:hypothetical protein